MEQEGQPHGTLGKSFLEVLEISRKLVIIPNYEINYSYLAITPTTMVLET